MLAGLSLTEASGVTNLRATVIRVLTPDGTLVVEVDDPELIRRSICGDAPYGARASATSDRGARPPVLQRRSGSLLEVAVTSFRSSRGVIIWRITDCDMGCPHMAVGRWSRRIMWQLAVWQFGSHPGGFMAGLWHATMGLHLSPSSSCL